MTKPRLDTGPVGGQGEASEATAAMDVESRRAF